MKGKQIALVIEQVARPAEQVALAIAQRLWQLNAGYDDCTLGKGNS